MTRNDRFHTASPGMLRGFRRLLQGFQAGFDIFQFDRLAGEVDDGFGAARPAAAGPPC
jgi:hypothetical protein